MTILKRLVNTREILRSYVAEQMKKAHEKGTPVIRPLFYDYPEDEACWDISDQYMFGPDILVAPILYEGMRSRMVYLPKGKTWKEVGTDQVYEGGISVSCDAPLDKIPVFTTNNSSFKFADE